MNARATTQIDLAYRDAEEKADVNTDHEQCPNCGSREDWKQEHAHVRCRRCGFVEGCCEGASI